MAKALHVEDVDSIEFQRKEWTVQRIGWALIGLLIAAALLGLFSIGPVSSTLAGGPQDGVVVEYERFTRHIGTVEMHIAVQESAVQNEKASVFIADGVLAGMRIENINPAPDSVTSTPAGSTYEFSAEPGSGPVIEIVYRPDDIGVAAGTIRAGDSGGVEIWQLTYP